jgi:hypothetical protein
MQGAVGVAGEDAAINGNYDDEVIPLSNLAGLLCMVSVDGDPLCVLAKCKELVRDSTRKSC